MNTEKSQHDLAEEWWQHISKEESDDALRLAGYYGHDMGVNADEVLEMWIAAGSPLVEEEQEPSEEEMNESFKKMANLQSLTDHDHLLIKIALQAAILIDHYRIDDEQGNPMSKKQIVIKFKELILKF